MKKDLKPNSKMKITWRLFIKDIQMALKWRYSTSFIPRDANENYCEIISFQPIMLQKLKSRHSHTFLMGKQAGTILLENLAISNKVYTHLYFYLEILLLRIYLKEDTSQQYKNTHAQDYSITTLY